MTPREMTTRLVAALDAARGSGVVVHEHELIEVVIEDAVGAEREACASIAEFVTPEDEHHPNSMIGAAGKTIAALIRARST